MVLVVLVEGVVVVVLVVVVEEVVEVIGVVVVIGLVVSSSRGRGSSRVWEVMGLGVVY